MAKARTNIPDVSPDAELVHLCGLFVQLEQTRQHAITAAEDTGTLVLDPAITAVQQPLVAAIAAARATTLDGLVGRTRALAVWAPDLLEMGDVPGSPCWDDQLVTALLRDLMALAA